MVVSASAIISDFSNNNFAVYIAVSFCKKAQKQMSVFFYLKTLKEHHMTYQGNISSNKNIPVTSQASIQ